MESALPELLQTRPPAVAPSAVDDLIARFLGRRSPRTREAYKGEIERFAEWLNLPPSPAVERLLGGGPQAANAAVLDYVNHLKVQGLKAATINRRLSALRTLIKVARMSGLVAWALEVESERREPYRNTRGPGLRGVKKVMATAAGRDDAKGARDRAIIRLAHDLGLRRAEIVSLDLEHVDLEEPAIAVLGKGHEAREKLTLPPETVAVLRSWLDERGQDPGPLFLNLDRGHASQRISGTSVYRMIAGLGKAAGVKVRPHGIRHSAITTVLDSNGGDVRAAQRFSRHADVRTLQLYDDNREDLAGKMARIVAAKL